MDKASSSRLAHLDALRGVAALLVAWAHFSERLGPVTDLRGSVSTALYALPNWLNLGRVGVVLFFGLSGFVIYGSLDKGGSHPGRRFAVNRFFRLYPAFWLSLILGALLLWPLAGQPVNWPVFWANATMDPSLFGQPRVRDLYWTLEIELVFYAACWALYRTGLMRRPVLLPVLIGASLVDWLVTHAHAVGAPTPSSASALPRHLGVMFWGALVRQSYDETAGFRAGVRANAKAKLLLVLTVLMMAVFAPGAIAWLARTGWAGRLAGPTPPPSSIAYLIALPLFWGWVALMRFKGASLLPWLGTISYSLYLFHPYAQRMVLKIIPADLLATTPLWVWLFVAIIIATAISALTYYAVERPFMRLGVKLNQRHGKTVSPDGSASERMSARIAP